MLAVGDVIAFIDAERKKRPHLGEFIEARGKASGNLFVLPP